MKLRFVRVIDIPRNTYFVIRSASETTVLLHDTLSQLHLDYADDNDHGIITIKKASVVVKVKTLGPFSLVRFCYNNVTTNAERFITDTVLKFLQ